MQIIPVIDLKNGHVVHARQGQRQHYRRLVSPLAQDSTLEAVLQGFLALYPFSTFYLADLNAITGEGECHRKLIERVVCQYSQLEFWVDAGWQWADLAREKPKNYKPVLGTESQREAIGSNGVDFVLSLDFCQGQSLGDPRFFADARYWPSHVIVMNLNRVGSEKGPDFERLAQLKGEHPQKCLIAAGGVRHLDDLRELQDLGVDKVLLATALHNRSIDPDILREL